VNSLSNLALLAQRYSDSADAANGSSRPSLSGALLSDLRARRQGDGSAPGSHMHSSADVSDRDASDALGANSDDDVANGDDSLRAKHGGALNSRNKAGLQRKSALNSISKKFKDITSSLSGRTKQHSLAPASASTATLASIGQEDGDDPSGSGSGSGGGGGGGGSSTRGAGHSGPPSSSLHLDVPAPSPLSSTPLSDAAADGTSMQPTPSPMANLRDYELKQQAAASPGASLLAKDSAHWKPRSSSIADVAAAAMQQQQHALHAGRRDSASEESSALRLHLNGQPTTHAAGSGPNLSPPLSARASSLGDSPGASLRSLAAPPPLQRPPSLTTIGSASTTLLQSLTSPNSKRTLTMDGSATRLFLRKNSTSAATPDNSLGYPSAYRERSGSAGAGLMSPSLMGIGAPDIMGNSAMREVAALRQVINQHVTDMDMQIGESQRAL